MTAAHQPVLRIEGVSVSFSGNSVLKKLDLEINLGFTGLIGPNGAGKTTLFNAVSGYVRPDEGAVRLGVVDLCSLRPVEIARLGVGRTFQTPRLISELSVRENIMLTTAQKWWTVGGERSTGRRADELLERFGQSHIAHQSAGSLSIQARKIVEVIRALARRPRLLLLDEPAAGLARPEVEALLEPLRAEMRSAEMAVLIIEHDVELVANLCPVAGVLNLGRIVAWGSPKEILRQSEVIDAYLGVGFVA